MIHGFRRRADIRKSKGHRTAGLNRLLARQPAFQITRRDAWLRRRQPALQGPLHIGTRVPSQRRCNLRRRCAQLPTHLPDYRFRAKNRRIQHCPPKRVALHCVHWDRIADLEDRWQPRKIGMQLHAHHFFTRIDHLPLVQRVRPKLERRPITKARHRQRQLDLHKRGVQLADQVSSLNLLAAVFRDLHLDQGSVREQYGQRIPGGFINLQLERQISPITDQHLRRELLSRRHDFDAAFLPDTAFECFSRQLCLHPARPPNSHLDILLRDHCRPDRRDV